MADKFCIELGQTNDINPIEAVSCSGALSRIPGGVLLFTPALLVTHAGFDRDPVQEFDSLFPAEKKDERPFIVDLVNPTEVFFTGLGVRITPDIKKPINWDRRLYAIAKSREAECNAFFGGIYWLDRVTNFHASSFKYTITIPDPTSKRNPIETIDVNVFGVTSNKFVAYIEEQIRGPARARRVSASVFPPYLISKGVISGFVNNPNEFKG